MKTFIRSITFALLASANALVTFVGDGALEHDNSTTTSVGVTTVSFVYDPLDMTLTQNFSFDAGNGASCSNLGMGEILAADQPASTRPSS